MPFDEEEDVQEVSRIGLKKVSTRKSYLDDKPSKPSREDFEKSVEQIRGKKTGYALKTSQLLEKYSHLFKDKTLPENKNIFQKQIEVEVIKEMVELANEINNDPNEMDGVGSVGWLGVLLKLAITQKDKINELEYKVLQLNSKVEKIESNTK